MILTWGPGALASAFGSHRLTFVKTPCLTSEEVL